MLRAALDLEPLGEPRAGRRVIVPKGGGRPFVTAYTPKASRVWREAAVLMLRSVSRGAPPLEGPLGLKAVFRFPMPQGEFLKRSLRPRRWHVARPDVDNALKALQDAMQEAGWLRDDSQVAELVAQKIVARQGERPAVHVTLYPLLPLHDDALHLPLEHRENDGLTMQPGTEV